MRPSWLLATSRPLSITTFTKSRDGKLDIIRFNDIHSHFEQDAAVLERSHSGQYSEFGCMQDRDILSDSVLCLERQKTCSRSSGRVHRVSEAAWHDHLQLPVWATAMQLRKRGMVETCWDREIFSVTSLDRIDERCNERWIAIGRIFQFDQQS